jgi:hypothetical protein
MGLVGGSDAAPLEMRRTLPWSMRARKSAPDQGFATVLKVRAVNARQGARRG